MTKLIVSLILAVLMVGAALFAFGTKIIPATGNAGITTANTISNAFQ